jgi:hypothetical protein
MCKGYNGWDNYETWAVNLWIHNDEGLQDYCNELASGYPNDPSQVGHDIRDYLEELCDESFDGILSSSSLFSDLMGAAMSSVNWHDIGEARIESAVDCGLLVKCENCDDIVLESIAFDVSDTYYTDHRAAYLCGDCIDEYEESLEGEDVK